MVVFVAVVVHRKHNMWSCYGLVCGCCRQSVNTICGSSTGGFVVFDVS